MRYLLTLNVTLYTISYKTNKEVIKLKQISIRIPNSLHAELLDEAKREGVSLNQLCLTKLARPLEWYRQRLSEKDG